MNIRKAFTLLEISIAVLVIGIILGSIIFGKNLIDLGKVKAQITQIQDYNSAVQMFKDQYGALPGDISAVRLNNSLPTVYTNRNNALLTAGDENGYIHREDVAGSAPPPTDVQHEVQDVFYHLSLAGLIKGIYTPSNSGLYTIGDAANISTLGKPFPKLKLLDSAGILAYASYDRRNYWHLGVVNNTAAEIAISPLINGEFARNIDVKIDDGRIDKGTVMGVSSSTWPYSPTAAVSAPCGTGASTATDSGYNITATGKCGIIILIPVGQQFN